MSSLIDPQTLVGERVFVETKMHKYVGTLKVVREYSFELEKWFEVHLHDSNKIITRGEYGTYDKFVMTAGGSKELLKLNKNTLKCDPEVEDDPDEGKAVVREYDYPSGHIW